MKISYFCGNIWYFYQIILFFRTWDRIDKIVKFQKMLDLKINKNEKNMNIFLNEILEKFFY